MHEGCSGSFEDGRGVVDKIRMMGFASQPLPMPMDVDCRDCGETFSMELFETACPACGSVHGVTPCHAFDPANVASAGKGY
ncbi:MAG: hydrogenase maturation nickel metallochaperone HypA [Spirochaetales bacterium]|nr:hydrogenase maturation nickel metallochaperone HypA [Spirochaetales bacterium]